jgi:hypothetical protein
MIIFQYVHAKVKYVKKMNFVEIIVTLQIVVILALLMDVQTVLLLVAIWGVILANRDTISNIKVPAQLAAVKFRTANTAI